MKKVISWIAGAAIVTSLAATSLASVFAATDLSLSVVQLDADGAPLETVSSIEAQPGETYNFGVVIDGSAAAFKFDIETDLDIEDLDYSREVIPTNPLNMGEPPAAFLSDSSLVGYWDGNAVFENAVVATFSVTLPDAEQGVYPIDIAAESGDSASIIWETDEEGNLVFDEDGNTIYKDLDGVEIEVAGLTLQVGDLAWGLKGDVNEDGTVDLLDLGLLLEYNIAVIVMDPNLPFEAGSVAFLNADVNEDDTVNLADLGAVLEYNIGIIVMDPDNDWYKATGKDELVRLP